MQQRIVGLGESDSVFRGLLESAPDAMVIVDDRGDIVLVNRQTERLFGYERSELIGVSVDELVPERFKAQHHVHRTEYFSEPAVRPMAAGVGLSGRRKDGTEFPVEISLSPLETSRGVLVSAAIRDVTGRRAAEERFRALLESAPDAMVIVAATGRIELINRRVEELFGYARADLLGQPVEVLVPDRFRPAHGGHRDRFAASPVVRPMGAGAELYGLRADGTEFPVEISLSPIETGEGLLVSAAIRDVTERKETEGRLQLALETEREVTEQLREVDRLKDEFLAIVSHELRTPLMAIGGFSEILLDSKAVADPDRRQHLISRIAANATEMAWMIEQLLDYSRLQAGRVSLRPREEPLRELIGRCVTSIEHVLTDHAISIKVPNGTSVMVDERGFARILTNLLTNAAKFAPAGTAIDVSAAPVDGFVRIAVADEGPGIGAEDLQRVFERFYQASEGVQRRGAGIGLSIAERYVDLHGGKIYAESTLGKGSIFSFTVRAADEPG